MNKIARYGFGILVLGSISFLSFYAIQKFLQSLIDARYTKIQETEMIFKNVK